MVSRIHHAALAVRDFDWYVAFFEEVFHMTAERTAGTKPCRQLWFAQGIQINEAAEAEDAGEHAACDHISLGVDIDPVEAAKLAMAGGCRPAEGKGAHWFALPNGVLIEMKPLR